jgi:hypothetical protein
MREVWCPEGDDAVGMSKVKYCVMFILGECMACTEFGSMFCDDVTCGRVLIF